MDLVRWRRSTSVLGGLLAVVVVILRLWQARTALVANDDFTVYWQVARGLLDGGDPWVRGFVYLPGAVLAFLPLGLVGEPLAADAWLVLSAVAVAATAAVLARRHQLPVGLTVAGVFAAFPTESALQFGNVTALQLPLLAGAAVALTTRRWRTAGLLVGVGIVLKPVLVVCLLVFVLRRRWVATGIALAVPILTSAAVLAVAGSASGWSATVRDGLGVAGRDPSSADLAATLSRLGLPTGAALLLAGVVLVTAGYVVLAAHRRRDDETVLLVPLLAAFLVGSVAWAHYPLLLLPLVLASLRADRLERVLAATAAACFLLPEVVAGQVVRAVPPGRVFTLLTAGLLLVLLAGLSGVPGVRRWVLRARRRGDGLIPVLR